MTELKLRQMFKNLSDCYADTGRFENDGSYTEGEVIQAMTEDRFIEVLKEVKFITSNTLLYTDWREVAKEKPQDKQYVIVYARGGRMLMAYYKNGIFFCYDIASEELEEIEEPTHWMPQPPNPI